MDGLNTSIETIYFYAFIIIGVCTLLYIFLGDVLEGIFDMIPDGILNPTLILSFLTILSCTGYLFERFTAVHSFGVFVVSLMISLILSTILHQFVLLPLASAESSLVYAEEDLKGRRGKVILTIPQDGYGEVLIESVSGNISKSAKSFENVTIPSETNVLIIDVKDGVLYASELETLDDPYKK